MQIVAGRQIVAVAPMMPVAGERPLRSPCAACSAQHNQYAEHNEATMCGEHHNKPTVCLRTLVMLRVAGRHCGV